MLTRSKKSWNIDGFLVEGVCFDGLCQFRAKDITRPYLVYNIHLDAQEGFVWMANTDIGDENVSYYQDVLKRLEQLGKDFRLQYPKLVNELKEKAKQ